MVPAGVVIFDPDVHAALLPQLAQVHIDCILIDHMIATFLPPLNTERIVAWWGERAQEVVTRQRAIILFLEEGGAEVAGTVMLSPPGTETFPFRATVEKLIVSPRHRQKGIARAMMTKLEEVALARGSTLLVLDTEIGSPAENVYPRLGYTAFATLKECVVSPKDGSLKDELYFYKDLRKAVSSA